jgi:hypothetical protein
MIREPFTRASPDADVQIVPLPDAPGVPFQVATEEQLWCSLIDRRGIASVQKELRLLRNNGIHSVAVTL